MNLPKELWETIRKLSALEMRTEDVLRAQERLEGKLDRIIEKISALEVRQEEMRQSVRNEILADIKADLVRANDLIKGFQAKLADNGPPEGGRGLQPGED